VSLIQRLLNRFLGLDLPVDGIMNVDTRSALRSFENQGDPSMGNDGAPGGQVPAPFGDPDQQDQPAQSDQPDQMGQPDQPGGPGQSGEPDQPGGDTNNAQEEYGYF
jgi:hypothetical protein